jgi:hypothetical protein
MPKPTSNGKPVNIVRQGHTTDGAFGSDPGVRKRFGGAVRDLKAK